MGRKSDRSVAFVERPRIEFVLLANHAEAVNGMLNMLGGLWTDHTRQIVPGQTTPPSPISIALAVFVPWNDTNRMLNLNVTVEDDDGGVLLKLDTKLSLGRPPQLQAGAGQYAPIAINGLVNYPKAGGYRVIARLDGNQDTKTWPFRVHDVAQALAS